MPGTSINDLAGIQPEAQEPQESIMQETAQVPQRGFDLGFLKTVTGDGEIESYANHPLNFDGSKATSRILRGCTGIFGSLNFALADVIIGFLEHMKGRKQSAE